MPILLICPWSSCLGTSLSCFKLC